MLTKFESKSQRVKGLAFHPSRPWVLASLHSGTIQLWSYRIKTLIDKFDEHEGPVRGVCFHNTQPLFVSGGDDYRVKVWNYKTRKCLFTLMGHLDYIRTVQFHHEYPWILSASDDQTVRVWNWQSRNCVAVLTGHNHYVMCAQFHPKDDLVVSASLDQTVRVWDISGLRKKNVAPGGRAGNSGHGDDNGGLRLQNDLFGNNDATVKYILEEHDRGVNWASFHPSSPLIVSGADDRQVKLWRMNDSKAWEVDSFRGHFNNVSCALFHPRQDLILSNSEDKTIRVWDMGKRTGIQTFRREQDRFWILAAHPRENLFAAGHDTGLIVFKLERERPAFTVFRNQALYYVKDRYLRFYDFSSARDVPVLAVRRTSTAPLRSISYSPQDRAILLCSDADGGHYDLYQIPRDGNKGGESVDSKRGLGSCAVFVGRKRFAVLKSFDVIIKNMKNEEVKRCQPPHPTDRIFEGPIGTLLLRSEDRVTLYDIQQRRALAELHTPTIKRVVWSQDKRAPLVALMSKDHLIIATRKLEQLCMVHETLRIKSGVWDESGVFIYTTLNHLKYCLPNGDSGIIRTMEIPVYLTAVSGTRVYCLDREGKNRIIMIDNTEFLFKDALIRRKYDVVLKMVRDSNLIGQSIISYLQKKGFPEVALHFVRDEKTRFNLALECGNIDVALDAALKLNEKDCWHQLGREALRHGNHQVVEMAYQRTKNFEQLSFLYLVTGNVTKLRKMIKIAEMRNDTMGRFHNALYLGNVEERIAVLESVGHFPLAYITASTYGLEEKAAELRAALEERGLPIPDVPGGKGDVLRPAIPLVRLEDSNWPLLTVSKGYFKGGGLDETAKFGVGEEDDELDAAASAWGGDLHLGDEELLGAGDADLDGDDEDGTAWGIEGLDDDVAGGAGADDEEGGGWGGDDDLEGLEDLDAGDHKAAGGGAHSEAYWVPPQPGPSAESMWCRNSSLAADHAAAGSFESCAQLLHGQVGAIEFEGLRSHYLSAVMASHMSLPGMPLSPSHVSPALRDVPDGVQVKGRWALPRLVLELPPLIGKLRDAYKATTEGKFGPALSAFQEILHTILLITVKDRTELDEVRELIGLCREYVLGLQLEIARKENAADPKRATELAAYFTHCNLQAVHLMLSLRSAMTSSYKLKNYALAASFGRRLLELNPKPAIATQARKVVKFADTNNTDAVPLDYDERNPFAVCAISHKPIFKGSLSIKCGYCSATFHPDHKGKVCPVCTVGSAGADHSGLQLMFNQR